MQQTVPRPAARWRSLVKPPLAACLLVLAVFALGCASGGKKKAVPRDYPSDLDSTVPTVFDATLGGVKRPLGEFGSNNPAGFSDKYLFGLYRNPLENTGGNNFYVFPDGTFVIEEFASLRESITVAQGKWKLEGNTLSVSDLQERQDASIVFGLKWINDQYGHISRLRIFVTSKDGQIGDTLLVTEEAAALGPHLNLKYFRRIEHFPDWEKEKQRLLAN